MSATDRYSHQLLYATVRQRDCWMISRRVYLRPGTRSLPKTNFVHNITSAALPFRKAIISDLVADGVPIRWQGKGTFVQSLKVENAPFYCQWFYRFWRLTRQGDVKEKVIEQGTGQRRAVLRRKAEHPRKQRSVPSLPGDVSR